MGVTLKNSEIKTYREAALAKQKSVCPLCGLYIEVYEAALDHCHVTGHVRQVLHRSCNAAEGKILHWAGVRSRGDDPKLFLKNLLKYWEGKYSHNPLHPKHLKPKPKRKRRSRVTKQTVRQMKVGDKIAKKYSGALKGLAKGDSHHE